MAINVTWDYIDETSFAAETPEAARAVAEQFVALARDPETVYEEDTSPAGLLITASECFYDANDPLQAYEAAREAQEAEGEAAPDKRVYLLDALLRTGQEAEATQLADEIRAEKLTDPLIYSFIGDSYDVVGNNHQAQVWFNRGIRMMDELIKDSDGYEPEEVAEMLEDREILILGRQLVRSEAGLEPDDLDHEALEILASHEDDEETE
ncbi:hypothetical protein [Lysinibacter cavernae]|uniref:Tetratricopeptide (TPR) repeat protein n=1 Tax=Lysinibacter cavernae TaxID=1640652 RepID=A0A7X5R2I7_9MICO|nr:hypothetical protein [Lysinibacter cavernae]NIH54421.1 tetratricopeptide (TPR) repeat protein [Lysinibacter cavernae]